MIYETTAQDIALSFDKVVASRCYTDGDVIVVAVLPAPIYTASERSALREDIRLKIENEFEIRTIVTFDVGAYLAIHENMSAEEIASLFKKVGYSPL